MNKIIIFSGTTEGRTLSEGLTKRGIDHAVSVATDYGELMMTESPYCEVHVGRMTEEEMEEYISQRGELVYDATHPFAVEVTQNIKKACIKMGIPYIRIIRDRASQNGKREKGENSGDNNGGIYYYDDMETCLDALIKHRGNILLTTGSKELSRLKGRPELLDRIYARVLPSVNSIELCNEAGLFGEHIIAMHGPFNKKMNMAQIEQYDIKCLVTKETGSTGGYYEKIMACDEMEIDAFVIGRPHQEEGMTVKEALANMDETKGIKHLSISLVGIGPGNQEYLTFAARSSIDKADLIFGAPRMIEDVQGKEKYPYYLAKDVLPVILDKKPDNIAILFSGDTGFYSGAKKMQMELGSQLQSRNIDCDIDIIPGISSLSYFAAKIGIDYSRSELFSLHGRDDEEGIEDLFDAFYRKGQVFTLLSSADDIDRIIKYISDNHMDGVVLTIGANLSYPEERIISVDPMNDSSKYNEGTLGRGSFVALLKGRE